MHGFLSRRRDERGAVAIIVAITLTALLVIVAMVLDFGLLRVDRQVDKSAADSAALAGMHALNGGDADARPFAGVCAAISYLAKNNTRFSGLTSSPINWTDGDGHAIPGLVTDPCTNAAWLQKPCVSAHTSWATFAWTGSTDVNVVIKSGYLLGTYNEDSLPAAAADNDDSASGCDQLAVIINQQRSPGLGSLATSSELKTSIRSVGRVKSTAGGYAPAMLLLRRSGCPGADLTAGGGGAGSFIHVTGKISTNGLSQPGSIHVDSDGTGCSSGNPIYQGKADAGIVAYAAPLAGGGPDPTKPGQISYVTASLNDNVTRDGSALVYGSKKLDAATTTAADRVPLVGRPLVSRSPVDDRYRKGVQDIITAANAAAFSHVGANLAASQVNFTNAGYQVATCSGTTATIPAYNPLKQGLFIACADVRNANVAGWKTVVFGGTISPQGTAANTVLVPDASKVYVVGTAGAGTAIDVKNTFSVNTTGNVSAGKCIPGSRPTAQRAVLVIKGGNMGTSNSGGFLQLCNTTAVLMGGSTTGCVPTYTGAAPAPTNVPCGGGVPAGTGIVTASGGSFDWTAPDRYDVMTLANGQPDPALAPAWKDVNGPEDLALWAESYSNGGSGLGGSTSPTVRGVFMTPNVVGFNPGGNATFNLTNAQFVATSIHLNGGVQVTMSVDPNSAVTLPRLDVVGLVR